MQTQMMRADFVHSETQPVSSLGSVLWRVVDDGDRFQVIAYLPFGTLVGIALTFSVMVPLCIVLGIRGMIPWWGAIGGNVVTIGLFGIIFWCNYSWRHRGVLVEVRRTERTIEFPRLGVIQPFESVTEYTFERRKGTGESGTYAYYVLSIWYVDDRQRWHQYRVLCSSAFEQVAEVACILARLTGGRVSDEIRD
jgi:hypothetical protein